MRNKIVVSIGGKDYTMVAVEDEAYVRRCAALVDKQLQEVLTGSRLPQVDGAVLAVAAADERAVNHQAAMLCRARGIPVSTADRAEESTFFFPAVCAGDGLTAGLVSVDGNHKKVRETAVKIRKLLSGGAE